MSKVQITLFFFYQGFTFQRYSILHFTRNRFYYHYHRIRKFVWYSLSVFSFLLQSIQQLLELLSPSCFSPNSKHNRLYFPSFSSCLTIFLHSFGHAISVNNIVFFDGSSSVRSGLRGNTVHSHWMFSVQEDFLSIFFNHFSKFPVRCIPLCIFREQSIFYSPLYC